MVTILEDFIDYCKLDNKRLAEDIEIWIADYFDLRHRCFPLTNKERVWIKKNLSTKNQIRILGIKVDSYRWDMSQGRGG